MTPDLSWLELVKAFSAVLFVFIFMALVEERREK